MYVTYFDSKLELDVTDKIFIVPTGDQTKLPKYNEWALDGNHTGYVTETLNQSFDTDGLFWAYQWIAIVDITNYIIDYYVFSEMPYSIDVVADGGAVTDITINTNTLVWHDSVLWANITVDSDTDDRPDYLDHGVEGSVSWLLGAVGSNIPYAKLYTKDLKEVQDANGKEVWVLKEL